MNKELEIDAMDSGETFAVYAREQLKEAEAIGDWQRALGIAHALLWSLVEAESLYNAELDDNAELRTINEALGSELAELKRMQAADSKPDGSEPDWHV